MIILMMGPQGSGKSTQAKLLAHEVGFDYFSAGQMLRDTYYQKKEYGDEAFEFWSKGELVPNELMIKLFDKHYPRNPYGCVVDGFPRSMDQYEDVEKYLPELIDLVVYVHLEGEDIMKRINSRKRIEQREDETEEAVKRRLEIYDTQTKPLIETFKNDGIPVLQIDGKGTIDDIHVTILREIFKLLERDD